MYMNILILLIIFGLFIYAAINLSKKWLPKTATQSFKSFSEIKSYFYSSVSIIRSKKWILILPLGLTVSQTLIIKCFQFLFQPDLSAFKEETTNVIDTIVNLHFLKNLIEVPQMLNFGFYSMSVNLIFIAFFVFCSLTYKCKIKKLKKNSTKENQINVHFLEKILKLSLALMFSIILCAGILYLFNLTEKLQISCFIIIGIFLWSLSLLFLSIFSLLEAYIIFSVKEVIQAEGLKSNEILNKSLSIIKPLFIVNIVFSMVTSVTSLLLLPRTISQFIGFGENFPYHFFDILQNVSAIYSYVLSFLTIFVFCIPLTLAISCTGPYQALKKNITLIKNNLTKYLSLVGLSILILFLPSCFETILNSFVSPYSWNSIVIEIFIISLYISFSVIIYIVMFKFFLDSNNFQYTQDRT